MLLYLYHLLCGSLADVYPTFQLLSLKTCHEFSLSLPEREAIRLRPYLNEARTSTFKFRGRLSTRCHSPFAASRLKSLTTTLELRIESIIQHGKTVLADVPAPLVVSFFIPILQPYVRVQNYAEIQRNLQKSPKSPAAFSSILKLCEDRAL